MKCKKLEFWEVEFTNFGSLDMECDFCKKNCYNDNFHFTRNRNIELVICQDCLAQVIAKKVLADKEAKKSSDNTLNQEKVENEN